MRRAADLGRLCSSNPQCVIGAALGLAAVFLPWLVLSTYQTQWPYPPMPVSGYYEPTIDSSLSLLGVASLVQGLANVFCTLFAIGVIVSFYTPLGGIVEGVGLAGFALSFAQAGGEYRVAVYELSSDRLMNEYPQFLYATTEFVLGVGFLFGVVSTFIVLSSTSAAVRDSREGPAVHNRVAALAWKTSRTK